MVKVCVPVFVNIFIYVVLFLPSIPFATFSFIPLDSFSPYHLPPHFSIQSHFLFLLWNPFSFSCHFSLFPTFILLNIYFLSSHFSNIHFHPFIYPQFSRLSILLILFPPSISTTLPSFMFSVLTILSCFSLLSVLSSLLHPPLIPPSLLSQAIHSHLHCHILHLAQYKPCCSYLLNTLSSLGPLPSPSQPSLFSLLSFFILFFL